MFLQCVNVFGLSGDHLFAATDAQRREVAALVREGLQSGCVRPVQGAKTFSAPAALGDALRSVEY